jgi:hypothetical protein
MLDLVENRGAAVSWLDDADFQTSSEDGEFFG